MLTASTGGSGRTAVLLGLLLIAAVQGLRFFVPVDDAYISFRYAENLAAGHGVVFNPGERVEGYTNFLWVVLLALCRLLGAPIPAASQWLGLVLTLGTLLVAADLGRRLSPEAKWGGIPAALLLSLNPGLAGWAGAGLEVPLFSFLSLLTALLFQVERTSGRPPWRWPVAACLAAMARPEGVLLFLVALAVWILHPQHRGQSILRRGLRPLVAFLAPGIPYFLWRWDYYGYLLPNTYAAKSGLDRTVVIHGLFYVRLFLEFAGGAILALGALLSSRTHSATVRLLLVQSLIFILYVVLIGGDGYPYTRFLVPVAVLLAPAAEQGYRQAWSVLSTRWLTAVPGLPEPVRSPAAAGFLLISLAGAASWPSFLGPQYVEFWREAEAQNRRRPIGEWLAQNFPRGALLALNPVGMIPYLAGLPTLDQLGLTDAHVARSGQRITNTLLLGHNRHDAAYVLSRQPEILILGQATVMDVDPRMVELCTPGKTTFDRIAPAVVRDFVGFPGDDAMWRMPGFRRLYAPTIAKLGRSFFYYFALDRRALGLEERFQQGSATAADHAEMASILKSKGEVALALEEARTAESTDPSFGRLRAELEMAATSPPDRARAEDASREALRRAEAHLERGDSAAAERELKEGLDASPQDPDLLFKLGVLYDQALRPADAQAAYLRAVAARPDHAAAWNNLGILHARAGNLEEARKCWERAVSLDPSNPAKDNLRRLLEGRR